MDLKRVPIAEEELVDEEDGVDVRGGDDEEFVRGMGEGSCWLGVVVSAGNGGEDVEVDWDASSGWDRSMGVALPPSSPHPGIFRYSAPICAATGLIGTLAQLGLPCGAAQTRAM